MTTRRQRNQGADASRRSTTASLYRPRPEPTTNNGATSITGLNFSRNTPIVRATSIDGKERYFSAATTAFEVRLGTFGERLRDLPLVVSGYDPYNVTRSQAEYGKHAARNAAIVRLQAGYADEHGTYLPLPCTPLDIAPASTWEAVAPQVEDYCTSALHAVRVATGQGDAIYDSGYETIQG